MTRIHLVDRDDQAEWFIDLDATNFVIEVKDKQSMMHWLQGMTTGTVVISSQGTVPPPGLNVHHSQMAFRIRGHYRIYFADDRDATTFKLAWWGEQ